MKRTTKHIGESPVGAARAVPRRSVGTVVKQILSACARGVPGALIASSALSNPHGGTVVKGTASIEAGNASTLNVVQTSQDAVIDWASFSIGTGQLVDFIQPSANSATLNRVMGAQPSLLDGVLDANGRVFLINSSGILFGKSARLDVGALVATTSNIADNDFMAGRYNFVPATVPTGVVSNEGTITVRDGGFAALVAPSVTNLGVIKANLGRIALGGGQGFTIDLYGDRLINFALPSSDAVSAAQRVNQAGSLIADGGQVLLSTQTASAVVSGVINMSGVVQARSAGRGVAGAIILDSGAGQTIVSGTLDASGGARGSGGSVDVYGDGVNLLATANINASGATGGGSVLIGGGLAGERTPRASTTSIASGAAVNADAITSGHGGTVSIWGTNQNSFAGSISALGGSQSGNGGFIEISTHGVMQYLGAAVAAARRGSPGAILLDPSSITIQSSANMTIEPGGYAANNSLISGSALSALLRAGQNVSLEATNTINDNDVIDGRPLSGALNPAAQSGSITMTAGAIVITEPIITNNAAITLNATSREVSISGAGFLYIANGTGSVGSAPINITAEGGISSGSSAPGYGQLVSLGTITLSAKGAVTLGAALDGLSTSQGNSGIGALVVTSSGSSISLAGVNSLGQVDLKAAAGVALAGDSIVAAGPISLAGGSGTVSIGAVGGDASKAALEGTGSSPVTIDTSGAIALSGSMVTGGGSIVVGDSTPPGSFIAASGAILQTAGTGGVTISSAGAVSLEGITTSGGAVHITGATVSDGGASIAVKGVGTNGAVVLTANGSERNAIVLQNIPKNATVAVGGSGNVTLSTPGGVEIGGAIVTNGGDINIGTSSAPVASLGTGTSSNPAVLQTSPTTSVISGAVNIYSSGNVSLNGVSAGGTVTVNTQGALSLATQSVTSSGGDIMLAAGGGTGQGITIAAIPSSNSAVPEVPAALATSSVGAVVKLTTTGQVTLDGGISTSGGDIDIGSSTSSAGTLLLGPGAVLQTGRNVVTAPTMGSINIFSSGDIDAVSTPGQAPRNLVASAVNINAAGSVDLDSLVGLAAAATPQQTTGIGSLTINAGGSVNLSGAKTSGVISIDASDQVVVGPLIASGVTINGPGVGASTSAGEACLQQGLNMSCVVTNGIDAGAGGVTIRVGQGSVNGQPKGAGIDVLAPIVSRGPVNLGLISPLTSNFGTGGPNAQINLSSDITTYGQPVTINGDVTMFYGLDLWSLQSKQKLNGPTVVPNDSGDTFCNQSQCSFASDPNLLLGLTDASGPFTAAVPGTGPGVYTFNANPFPPNFVQAFTNFGPYPILGVDVKGAPTNNAQPLASSITIGANGFGSSDTPLTVNQRVTTLDTMLTYASVTIDTTGGQPNSPGASVVISGNFSRYVPSNTACSACGNALTLYASHVNDDLNVVLGSGGQLIVKGTLGDTSAVVEGGTGNSSTTDTFSGDIVIGNGNDPAAVYGPGGTPGTSDSNLQIPIYGLFQVQITGGSPTPLSAGSALASSTQVSACINGCVNSLVINGNPADPVNVVLPGIGDASQAYQSSTGGLYIVPRAYWFDAVWTAYSATGSSSSGTPGANTSVGSGLGSSPGAGAATISNAQPTFYGITAGGEPGNGLLYSLSSENLGDVLPPVAESESRVTPAQDVSVTKEEIEETSLCALGAGRVADLGEWHAVSGVAPAVFARCKPDFK